MIWVGRYHLLPDLALLPLYCAACYMKTSGDKSDPTQLCSFDYSQINMSAKKDCVIGHIRILGIGLELAWNGGSCGGNIKKRLMHLRFKRFPALALVA